MTEYHNHIFPTGGAGATYECYICDLSWEWRSNSFEITGRSRNPSEKEISLEDRVAELELELADTKRRLKLAETRVATYADGMAHIILKGS